MLKEAWGQPGLCPAVAQNRLFCKRTTTEAGIQMHGMQQSAVLRSDLGPEICTPKASKSKCFNEIQSARLQNLETSPQSVNCALRLGPVSSM